MLGTPHDGKQFSRPAWIEGSFGSVKRHVDIATAVAHHRLGACGPCRARARHVLMSRDGLYEHHPSCARQTPTGNGARPRSSLARTAFLPQARAVGDGSAVSGHRSPVGGHRRTIGHRSRCNLHILLLDSGSKEPVILNQPWHACHLTYIGSYRFWGFNLAPPLGLAVHIAALSPFEAP